MKLSVLEALKEVGSIKNKVGQDTLLNSLKRPSFYTDWASHHLHVQLQLQCVSGGVNGVDSKEKIVLARPKSPC